MARTGISGDRSFGKVNRLHGRTNFLKIFQSEKSRKVSGQYCRMTSIETPDGETRFAIIVSRGAGRAVRRNRVKRVIRELLRNNKDLWPARERIIISISKPVSDEGALLSEVETMLRDLK